MEKVFCIIKILINILIYCFYSFFAVIIWNFLYWAYLVKVLNKTVPWAENPVHMKLAILVLVLVLIITFIFRKFLYIPVFKNKKWN